jgi:hypothetical protein
MAPDPACACSTASAAHSRRILLGCLLAIGLQHAQAAVVLCDSNAAPRVQFGVAKLRAALALDSPGAASGHTNLIAVGALNKSLILGELESRGAFEPPRTPMAKEGFVLSSKAGVLVVGGTDDSGTLYGCLELARRVRDSGGLPADLQFTDAPCFVLRGTCIGMQKTFILPGRKVYEYPYTPELFPWFYDRKLWLEYLDMLVENRMNSLYLWNGHPFSSLVRLPDYPEAIEVSEDVFRKNVEMFRWLTAECDRRGIWLVQMFYNIFLPKPLAEKHGISTQLSAPSPLAADYTRKAIAAFVREYPNVGLMVCLGEALQGTGNQVAWATQTILPGVHDGMRAAGLKAEPPVVIRTHAMDPERILPSCLQVYSNLFTETKYNGESLTTYEPRGKAQATHRAMARLGPHLVNVHILSNLEPFRYGAQRFIKKSVQASRDRLGATGLHLYPLAYWNWPWSPDVAEPPLKQWERDWMWFGAWARYAWNPDIPDEADRAFWVQQLSSCYGCGPQAAEHILNACNDAGEVAPVLIRRFGITEGNRQTLSLGITLDQLVNPQRYGAITELWESQAPPGERLDEFTRKKWSQEPHVGETPESALAEVLRFSNQAVDEAAAASPGVTRSRAEFERLANDMACIKAMADFYDAKVHAAMGVLDYGHSRDLADMRRAERFMEASVNCFRKLVVLTTGSYRFANSMQTGHRKIPFPGAANGLGTNYHWSQVLPLYEKELQEFRAALAHLGQEQATEPVPTVNPWPAAKVKLLSTNAEIYEVKIGARPFMDRQYEITGLTPELKGLPGVRFSHEAAKNGRYEPVEFEVVEPVRVLIGFFQSDRELWLQVPNLDVASHADERGGVDVLLRNAATIEGCPGVNIHAFRYEAGRHKLTVMGKGSFVILGVVPQTAPMQPRDAGVK